MWFLIAMLLFGQTERPPVQAEPGVYVITMGPGDASWEKFGHNMLWFHHPERDIDVAWNWGVFDFAAKNFVGHFLQGRLRYWMDGFKAQPSIDYYLGDDRTIWLQQLNLSPAQEETLWNFCLWNSKEENRYYKYDYFFDNCSTRVRDAVDLALDGKIKKQASTMPSDFTHRSETSRLVADDLILYTAVTYILGQPVDEKMSAWDEMFIPMRMRDRFNAMRIVDETGKEIPLVKSETLLHTSVRAPLRTEPPNRVGWFLLAGVIIGGLEAWLGFLSLGSKRSPKVAFAIVAISWSLLAGFAGCFLVYAWTLTDHIATHPNENILQMGPLMLPLVGLLPFVLTRRRGAIKAALALVMISTAACLLGFLLKIFPFMFQVNANMIALALPANLGLAWAIWKHNAKGAWR